MTVFIPPVVVPPFISAVLPPSPSTLSLTELIEDKLLKNFNQLPSNSEEPKPEVDRLDPDVLEHSKAVEDPEVEEFLAPPSLCLSLYFVCSHKIKTP